MVSDRVWLCHWELDRTGLASPVIPLVDPNDLIDLINFYGTKTISLVEAILRLDVSGERWDETGMSAVQNARRNETCLQLTSRQGSRGERSKECNAEQNNPRMSLCTRAQDRIWRTNLISALLLLEKWIEMSLHQDTFDEQCRKMNVTWALWRGIELFLCWYAWCIWRHTH